MQEQPNNLTHGVKLQDMLEVLVGAYGWQGMADRVNVRCFQVDPSLNSSLKFLRKTPWARTKVETLYTRWAMKKKRTESRAEERSARQAEAEADLEVTPIVEADTLASAESPAPAASDSES